MAWTEERVSTLRKLWAEGLSASQVAKQLKDTTRNAVIGKLHRLGAIGGGYIRPSRACKSRKRGKEPTAAPDPTTPLYLTLEERRPFQCAAVVDATRFEQRYCGHAVTGATAYCEGHEAMFFVLQDRKGKAA